MRHAVLGSLAAVLTWVATAAAAPIELKTDEQKTLYALGLVISRNLSSFNLTAAELEMVEAGLTDGVLARQPRVDLEVYGPQIRQLHDARLATAAAAEKKAGRTFLDRAAAGKGAARTASGLVIVTIKPGTGPLPKATDTVKVHYHGTLIDGTVFDSSVERGEPATFPLSRVIPCWSEGLQLVKVGGKSRLVCPPDLAYGDRGARPRIKPGATLVFEVELLEIVK